MIVGQVVAYFLMVFLCGIGLVLLVKPEIATGPAGPPLFRNGSRPIMAVIAAREIVLGLLAGGFAYTGNFHALLLIFSAAILITLIDGVALLKTKSIFGFILNDLVGLLLLFAVYRLWQDIGGF
jgi:small-conductance mechanosensitive channel